MKGKARHSHKEDSFRDWFAQHGLRTTAGRTQLIELLRKQAMPRTLAELHAHLAHLDFATVFRFIKILENKDLLLRHTWDDGAVRYELHSEEAHACHHHYVICRQCKQAQELDECTVERLERELHDRKGYTELSHSLQFFGICPDCQKLGKRRAAVSKVNGKSHRHRH